MSKQSTKIAGVYMIRNKINGKVYIGQSVDVRFRWKRYLWAVNSTASYSETKRSITKALREYGPENFEFKILDADPKCQDAYYRYEREAELIAKYKSYDPDYGYNSTTGFEGYLYYGEYKPRKQQRREILKRAKPIYLYGESNIEQVSKKNNLKVLAKLPIKVGDSKLIDNGKIELVDVKEINNVIEEIEKL